jgi:hypothetical protein
MRLDEDRSLVKRRDTEDDDDDPKQISPNNKYPDFLIIFHQNQMILQITLLQVIQKIRKIW